MRVIGVYRVYGCLWVSIDGDGCLWISISVWGVYGYLWLWEFMRVIGICEGLWVFIDGSGSLWVSGGI